ncbi:MAG: HEPN domain-containing protein [Candidatus Caldatribacteriaceae bacterium]
MKNITLAESYLLKVQKRLRILDVLMEEESYSDVAREAQEIVELALKGILRRIGIEPPKQHDVGDSSLNTAIDSPQDVDKAVETLAQISRWLRKEREFAFCGDLDFIPSLEYSPEDGERARHDAHFVVTMTEKVIRQPSSGKSFH